MSRNINRDRERCSKDRRCVGFERQKYVFYITRICLDSTYINTGVAKYKSSVHQVTSYRKAGNHGT